MSPMLEILQEQAAIHSAAMQNNPQVGNVETNQADVVLRQAPITTGAYLAKLNAWLNRPTPSVQPSNAFTGYEDIVSEVQPKTEWNDKELTDLTTYRMYYMSEAEIIKVGASFMSSLHVSMKKNVLAEMFSLAYNLRGGDNERIIGEIDPDLIDALNTVDPDAIGGVPIEINGSPPVVAYPADIAEAEGIRRLAISYCFLAASYIRFFTKDIGKFQTLSNRYESRFVNFYNFPLPLRGFHPTDVAAKQLKRMIDLSTIGRNTLYVFLYAANRVDEGQNIKNFLYDIHIRYTGLHSLTLFIKAWETLETTMLTLANAMNTPKIEKNLKSVLDVIRNFIQTPNENHRLGMWRYGRIFDPTFLSNLQTKKCLYFTLVLAFLTKQPKTPQHQDVFNIAQFKKVQPHMLQLAKAHAAKVVSLLNRDQLIL